MLAVCDIRHVDSKVDYWHRIYQQAERFTGERTAPTSRIYPSVIPEEPWNPPVFFVGAVPLKASAIGLREGNRTRAKIAVQELGL